MSHSTVRLHQIIAPTAFCAAVFEKAGKRKEYPVVAWGLFAKEDMKDWGVEGLIRVEGTPHLLRAADTALNLGTFLFYSSGGFRG